MISELLCHTECILVVFFRYSVWYCPALPEDSDIVSFLKALGVDWPTVPGSWSNEEREQRVLEELRSSPHRERERGREQRRSRGEDAHTERPRDGDEVKINLKEVVQEQGLQGYDPSLGTCTGKAGGVGR